VIVRSFCLLTSLTPPPPNQHLASLRLRHTSSFSLFLSLSLSLSLTLSRKLDKNPSAHKLIPMLQKTAKGRIAAIMVLTTGAFTLTFFVERLHPSLNRPLWRSALRLGGQALFTSLAHLSTTLCVAPYRTSFPVDSR
jgi:hypothetical protein